ncbi:hypothetical protein JM18_006166 [Phytophthora kernoviae]|uniref:B30.2/SPRY domain-containing protein n=2 Tax=Phytophthora kernoviae TaxID=325452 RepID=A0A8T0LVK6_9STRA|nr:hypothetical protein G195_007448 [Phytophthora kernoviae 00238/432]KAG2521266.1 hypothetical protein JM16_006229 [Phytophthora kernoviae]KAG2522409.1 hypothetical protein JM18_006166 [Phytophthora kernoviae]
MSPLYALDDAILAHVLSFSTARDVEAMTTASKFVALQLLPQHPEIWRMLFVHRWEQVNFPLNEATEEATNLEIDWRLRQLFKINCTESRIYQLLTHSIVPLPSGMDIEETRQSWGYSDRFHSIVPLEHQKSGANNSADTVTTLAFGGKNFGLDRSVRANVPFPTSFYLAVFKRRVHDIYHSRKNTFVYQIGATSSGYFEIGDGRYIPCESDREWFPVIGLDSPNIIHVNFGQQPFACDYVIDELFSECTGSGAALARVMLRSANNVLLFSTPQIVVGRRMLTDLGDELLAHVLSYSSPRDIEAMTVASQVVARDVVPCFPSIWKTIFCRRWEALNFPLDGVAQDEATLEINEHLDALFPSSCTESRKYQLLAHAIIPVPSYADIHETQRALGYTDAYHRIISLKAPELRESHVVDFALDGGMLGDDRCIRANVPFPMTFHVAVYKISSEDKGRSRPGFEDSMTSIGVVNYRFPLIGKQPGWTRRSYGYHSDDGCYYHGTPYEQGRAFGPMFKAGDTVGCGVHANPSSNSMHVFFTHNGEAISGEDGAYMECEQRNWYPAVGLDAYDALHVNFGQEPFVHSGITGELFETCCGMASIISQHLQWHSISDVDGESLSEGETSDDAFGSDLSDEELSARLFMRILAMRRAGMDLDIGMDMDTDMGGS